MIAYENQILLGKCLEILRLVPDDTFDSCVMDPPYGLGTHEPTPEEILQYLQGADLDTGGDFKGTDWEIPSVLVWKEIYRVLKPGAHLVTFGGCRTWDLIAMGARMAGFQKRDTFADNHPGLQWVQSQGMNKSRDIAKAIDAYFGHKIPKKGYKPITPEAKEWEGWGSGIKPTWEPIAVFRKPFKGTLAENVLQYGTGGVNINACRVRHSSREDFEQHKAQVEAVRARGGVRGNSWKNASDLSGANEVTEAGRVPPNTLFVHAPGCRRTGVVEVSPHPQGPDRFQKTTGGTFSKAYGNQEASSEPEYLGVWECVPGCPVAALDAQTGNRPSTLTGRADPSKAHDHPGTDMSSKSGFLGEDRVHLSRVYADAGGGSRFYPQFEGQPELKEPFFYVAKASPKEVTLDGAIENDHPCKKPIKLMRWLVKFCTPENGLILDPYCGSGSTLHAAVLEGMRFTGIDKAESAVKISIDRMAIVCEEEASRRSQSAGFELAMSLGAFDET